MLEIYIYLEHDSLCFGYTYTYIQNIYSSALCVLNIYIYTRSNTAPLCVFRMLISRSNTAPLCVFRMLISGGNTAPLSVFRMLISRSNTAPLSVFRIYTCAFWGTARLWDMACRGSVRRGDWHTLGHGAPGLGAPRRLAHSGTWRAGARCAGAWRAGATGPLWDMARRGSLGAPGRLANSGIWRAGA